MLESCQIAEKAVEHEGDNGTNCSWRDNKLDNTQQNGKGRLDSDRDETINHIVNECTKLVQRNYKTRHDWVGKVIHWELCKKFKFDHTTRLYKHKPESVLENETHKIPWDLKIKTDHQISARRQDLQIINNNRTPNPPNEQKKKNNKNLI